MQIWPYSQIRAQGPKVRVRSVTWPRVQTPAVRSCRSPAAAADCILQKSSPDSPDRSSLLQKNTCYTPFMNTHTLNQSFINTYHQSVHKRSNSVQCKSCCCLPDHIPAGEKMSQSTQTQHYNDAHLQQRDNKTSHHLSGWIALGAAIRAIAAQ